MTLILTILEREDGFIIYCDASSQGLVAVLMQHGRVITYASRQLKDYKIGCCGVYTKNVEALFVRCTL